MVSDFRESWGERILLTPFKVSRSRVLRKREAERRRRESSKAAERRMQCSPELFDVILFAPKNQFHYNWKYHLLFWYLSFLSLSMPDLNVSPYIDKHCRRIVCKGDVVRTWAMTALATKVLNRNLTQEKKYQVHKWVLWLCSWCQCGKQQRRHFIPEQSKK